MTDDWYPGRFSLPSKLSPGYRPGEQEMIARHLEEKGKQVLPEFGSKIPTPPPAERPYGQNFKIGCRSNAKTDKLRDRNMSICRDFKSCPSRKTIADLSQKHGISRKAVSKILRDFGLQMPKSDAVVGGPIAELDQQLADFYQQGWSLDQASKAFGVSRHKVFRALRKLNIPSRPTGQHGRLAGQTPPDMTMREAAE